MSKKRLDPTDISGMVDELDKSRFFRKPESQQNVLPAIQKAGKPALRQYGNTASQQESTEKEKVTYRFHPEAVFAIEDIQRILKREHHIKATLEKIAEEAIKVAYEELLESQKASKLARRLARKPA